MAELDTVADRLYELRPDAFTAARNEAAADARAAGDRQLAQAIGQLRRPTWSAWASNLLVRERRQEADRLLELGKALRQAHRDLAGGQLRELTRQQRQVVGALARQAARLAAEAGRRINEEAQREVEQTLHAALADPTAAHRWAAGRLTRPLSPPAGFQPAAGAGGQAREPTPHTAQVGERAPAAPARERAERERRTKRERAQREAADAARELRAREEELTSAEERVRRVGEEGAQAQRQAEALAEQLRLAEEARRLAASRERKAREQLRSADRAVHQARRRAENAAARAERLAREGGEQ